MAAVPSSRLAYIDWLRGLACVLMFQTHCYDAWLGGTARNSRFLVWSQLLGTFPAPLFLFLAGVSGAIVADKLWQKGVSTALIASKIIRRGAEILAWGLSFRLQEFVIALGWAPLSDVFRVDILNSIGVSMMLTGVMFWIGTRIVRSPGRPCPVCAAEGTRPYAALVIAALLCMTIISALTPLLWTTWRPRLLPWEIETYVNGVHNLGYPQASLFPIFPWAGFAFAGLAFGFFLMTDFAKRLDWRLFAAAGVVGVAMIYIGKFFDRQVWHIYPVYDFWHTSPEFFAMRIGFLFLFVLLAYGWCRWGVGEKGFSPLIQLGNTSLLVYWVHIELVYGKFSVLPRHSQTIRGASAGLLLICLMMLALSVMRTMWGKRKPAAVFSWIRWRQPGRA